jgi:hypothetical protein
MIIDDYPATIRFLLSTKSEAATESLPLLPVHYRHHALKGAFVTYTEGRFGCFAAQEIRSMHWVMGWFNFYIRAPAGVYMCPRKTIVGLVG